MLRTLTLAALLAAAAASAAVPAPAPVPRATPAWVAESNEHAKVLLDVLAKFGPEGAGQLGVEGHDGEVLDLKPRIHQRQQAALKDAIRDLRARLARATDPAVKQDLEIMIDAAQRQHDSAALDYDKVIPASAISRIVFGGIRALLDPRIAKERQAKAVERLRRYAGLEPGTTPITRLARERTEERLKVKGLLPPYKGELEQQLADSPRVIAGVKELFEASGLTGWQDAYAAIEKQMAEYDAWIKATLLPIARTDFRQPPELYADALKNFGVDIPPEQLMQEALVAFAELRTEMQTLAPRVAKEKGLKGSTYLEVIRALKKNQITGKDILPLYEARLAKLERIIRERNIVTLPDRKARIRLASEAESAMQPAPNMRPPRLIGNQGEYGEFVLPLKTPGRAGAGDLVTDDYTNDSVTWTLTAHETRPGHELQFSAMVEKGISTARAVYAFNSVNVEGWGLYAEAEVQPYLPLDGQLFTLQARLKRAARAFLDPMLNLGLIELEDARRVLIDEVGVSPGDAQQELDRYTFRAPGQATSYFYGYRRLLETRARAELALKDRFDRKAFNDFVLSQGLLPPALLQKAVMEEFVGR